MSRLLFAFFVMIWVVFLFLFFCWAPCQAGWGAGCEPVGSIFQWKHHAGDSRDYLYRRGKLAGCYDSERDTFRHYQGGKWGAEMAPPWKSAAAKPDRIKDCDCCDTCACGKKCKCEDGDRCGEGCTCGQTKCGQTKENDPKESNFGLDLNQLSPGRESYLLNGRAVSASEARSALTGGQIVDDSAKLRLTVIGSQPDRDRVIEDLRRSPSLADFKEKFLVQDYPPDHWAVARCGFHCSGQPTIYLQQPDGKVLHRQDNYLGAEDLATALRRVQPDYDSAKDPDKRLFPFTLPAINWSYVVTALLGAVLVFLRFRPKPKLV